MRFHHDARFPFLWATTTEEERVIRETRAAFEDENVQFYSWDIAAGFQALVRNGGGAWVWRPMPEIPNFKGPKGPIDDPKLAIDAVKFLPVNIEEGTDQPAGAMIFMKDFHKFFEKIGICRAALNIKSDLKLQAKTICFLSAEDKIPPELANDITVYDYPYPDDAALTRILEKMVEDNGEKMPKDTDKVVNAMRGLTWEEAENILALVLTKAGKFDVKMILKEKAAQIKTSETLEYGHFKETFDEVYGAEELKSYIRATIGKPKARGVLMTGAPGTAKSHIAKATANEFGLPCFILRLAKDKYQGVGHSRLRTAFKIIRAVGKSVVFMDEIEAIAVGISTGGDSGTGITLYKELLREMEDSHGLGIYWMATSNDLDPLIHESGGAIMSRFGGKFFIDIPNEKQAQGIAQIWSKKEGVEIPEDFDFEGYTGRDIASLAETMAMMECDAEHASQYIIPYGKAHGNELERIRQKAEGVCIWANKKEKVEKPGWSTRKVRKAA